MKTIYRYEVLMFATSQHMLTSDPLHVAYNPATGHMEFWAEFDTNAEVKPRNFTVLGTGHRVAPGMKYIGTAPRTEEGFVWHLYEV